MQIPLAIRTMGLGPVPFHVLLFAFLLCPMADIPMKQLH